jgi:hypothetical protein
MTPVSLMLEHSDKHANAYPWFDLFTNNQHDCAEKPIEWWKSTFCNPIGQLARKKVAIN